MHTCYCGETTLQNLLPQRLTAGLWLGMRCAALTPSWPQRRTISAFEPLCSVRLQQTPSQEQQRKQHSTAKRA